MTGLEERIFALELENGSLCISVKLLWLWVIAEVGSNDGKCYWNDVVETRQSGFERMFRGDEVLLRKGGF